jgi:hypothetical protein
MHPCAHACVHAGGGGRWGTALCGRSPRGRLRAPAPAARARTCALARNSAPPPPLPSPPPVSVPSHRTIAEGGEYRFPSPIQLYEHGIRSAAVAGDARGKKVCFYADITTAFPYLTLRVMGESLTPSQMAAAATKTERRKIQFAKQAYVAAGGGRAPGDALGWLSPVPAQLQVHRSRLLASHAHAHGRPPACIIRPACIIDDPRPSAVCGPWPRVARLAAS